MAWITMVLIGLPLAIVLAVLVISLGTELRAAQAHRSWPVVRGTIVAHELRAAGSDASRAGEVGLFSTHAVESQQHTLVEWAGGLVTRGRSVRRGGSGE